MEAFDGFRKPDPSRFADLVGRRTGDEPDAVVRIEVESVERAIDREGLRESPRTARQITIGSRRAAARAHRFESGQRFHGADQNRRPDLTRFATYIEAIRDTIDEVDVCVQMRREHRTIARGLAAERMRTWIAEFVGLGFDDATTQLRAVVESAHERDAEDRPRERDRRARQIGSQ